MREGHKTVAEVKSSAAQKKFISQVITISFFFVFAVWIYS